MSQVFAGSPDPDPNSLWKITFNKELATYANTFVRLQHIISSDRFLAIKYYQSRGYYTSYKSPLTEHTEGNKLKIFCLKTFNL